MVNEKRATIEDLEKARADLSAWDERWANNRSNNPNKFHSQRTEARRRVDDLTSRLKAQGDLPMTEHEKACAQLDLLAPNANQGDIIEFEGYRWRRSFYPVEKSRSGKSVTQWGKTWEREP